MYNIWTIDKSQKQEDKTTLKATYGLRWQDGHA